MYNIKIKKGYEPEDVLEKALKTLKARHKTSEKLRDPYLRALQEYSNNLYDVVMNAMIDDILKIMYDEKPLMKSVEDEFKGKRIVLKRTASE